MIESNMLYSVSGLAEILKTHSKNLIDFIKNANFTELTEKDGKKYVSEEKLDDFISKFVAYSEIRLYAYDIPNDLKKLSTPWAETIVSMYSQRFSFPASVSPQQGQFLKGLVCNLNPQIILETGCFIGISSIWMASGMEQINSSGEIHSVDLFHSIMPSPPYNYGYLKNPLDYAEKSALSAQLSHRINFYKADSTEVGQKFSELINSPIDLLYIDGDHSIEGCMSDFALFSPHVRIGGYILLHDIYPEHCGCDGPRHLIDNVLKKSPHFNVIEINTSPHNFGMALINKISEDKGSCLHRIKSGMTKTSLWQSIREKPLGKLIKKIASDSR